MSNEEIKESEKTNEYRAKLDNEILYLLRLKAMQLWIVRHSFACYDHITLYDYLMNHSDHENNTSYFTDLTEHFEDKISVTTLKRLYGKVKSLRPVSKNTLNAIAYFITDSQYSWDELQDRVDVYQENLEESCMYDGSLRFEVVRPRCDGKVTIIHSSKLHPGDKLTITFNNGHKLELSYEGKNQYKVKSTDSSYLKIGYSMVITNICCNGLVETGEVRDMDGNLLDGYKSVIIKTIEFTGNPDTELQRTLNRLERSGLGSKQK